jgi:hypothetical protein
MLTKPMLDDQYIVVEIESMIVALREYRKTSMMRLENNLKVYIEIYVKLHLYKTTQ